MKKLMEMIKETHEAITFVRGSCDQVTLFGNLLNAKQFAEIMEWLIAEGAEWQNDAHTYENMGCNDAFHLWLSLPYVKLYCGYVFCGEWTLNENASQVANMDKAMAAYRKSLDNSKK